MDRLISRKLIVEIALDGEREPIAANPARGIKWAVAPTYVKIHYWRVQGRTLVLSDVSGCRIRANGHQGAPVTRDVRLVDEGSVHPDIIPSWLAELAEQHKPEWLEEKK